MITSRRNSTVNYKNDVSFLDETTCNGRLKYFMYATTKV